MDQPTPSVQGTSTVAAASSSSSTTMAASKNRLSFNQNFILVPANNANLLANNGNVTNLIATHHNSIVNKGKIMILTTAPPVNSANRVQSSSGGTLVGQVISGGDAAKNSGNATLAINNSNMINITNIKLANQGNVSESSGTKKPTIQMLGSTSSIIPNKLHAFTSKNKILGTKSTISLYSAKGGVTEKNVVSSGSLESAGLSNGNTLAKRKSAKDKSVRKDIEFIEADSDQRDSNDGMDLCADESLLEAELKEIGNKHVDYRKFLKKDLKLQSDETVDRSSPELWPEHVPGVVKFLASNSSPLDIDDETTLDCIERERERMRSMILPLKTDSTDDESSIHMPVVDQRNCVEKFAKSFTITQYGLESNAKDSGDGGGNNSDNRSLNGDSRSTSPTNSTTSTATASKFVPPKAKEKNLPEWQKDLSEEEVSMLYGFGSLTASSLLDKVKEIQNLAYQLGLDEEREITRARFLNVLSEPVSMEEDYSSSSDYEVGNLFSLEELDKASGIFS